MLEAIVLRRVNSVCDAHDDDDDDDVVASA